MTDCTPVLWTSSATTLVTNFSSSRETPCFFIPSRTKNWTSHQAFNCSMRPTPWRISFALSCNGSATSMSCSSPSMRACAFRRIPQLSFIPGISLLERPLFNTSATIFPSLFHPYKSRPLIRIVPATSRSIWNQEGRISSCAMTGLFHGRTLQTNMKALEKTMMATQNVPKVLRRLALIEPASLNMVKKYLVKRA